MHLENLTDQNSNCPPLGGRPVIWHPLALHARASDHLAENGMAIFGECISSAVLQGIGIVVKFELFELYYWLELYELYYKYHKVHEVRNAKKCK